MTPASKRRRASTGIEGLDKMLDGGLIPGRTYILMGDHGSGKSTLCGHFLMEGIKRGEEVLYVTIDAPPSDISTSFIGYGWDAGKITILNAHPRVRDYKARGSLIEVAAQRSVSTISEMSDKEKGNNQALVSPDLSLPSLQLMLQKEFESKAYDRLVIDSILSLRMLGAEEVQWEIGINSIFRLLAEEGLTTIIVSDIPKQYDNIRPEFILSRGIIRMNRLVVAGKTYRAISAQKMRGSGHDDQVRPVKITSHGITVEASKVLPPEVVTQLAMSFPKP